MPRSIALRRPLRFAALLLLAAATDHGPLALAGDAPSVTVDQKKEKASLLAPAELAELAEKSSVKYSTTIVKDPGELPEFRHPGYPAEPLKPIENPLVIVGPGGSRTLTQVRFTPKTSEALKKAEELYQAKDYGAALEIYQAAAADDPECSLIRQNIGDCYLLTRNFKLALKSYQKSTALNPADFHGFWYQASALDALKKYPRARRMYARALAMSPRYANLIGAINNRSSQLGIKAEAEIFHPKAMARPEGDGYAVHTVESTHWWIYGLCKAIWLAEPDHREALTGSREHRWTNTEDLECTANLLARYESLRKSGETPPEPELDRLLEVLDAKLLGAFVSYEFGSRVTPDFVLYLDEGEQERIARFVERFVFQPK